MVLGTCKIRVNQICTSVDKMSINLGSSYFFFFFKDVKQTAVLWVNTQKKGNDIR